MEGVVQVRRPLSDRLPMFVAKGGHAYLLGDKLITPLQTLSDDSLGFVVPAAQPQATMSLEVAAVAVQVLKDARLVFHVPGSVQCSHPTVVLADLTACDRFPEARQPFTRDLRSGYPGTSGDLGR